MDKKRQQGMIARIVWTLLLVGASVAWIVLSYRPEMLAGIQVTFGAERSALFLWLFAGSALLFVLLQAVVVAAVGQFPARVSRGGPESDEQASDLRGSGDQKSGTQKPGAQKPVKETDIRLHRGVEYLWTALPLLISIVFFWAIWRFLL